MVAELEWWFYVFILPELVVFGIGLVAFLIAAAFGSNDRR